MITWSNQLSCNNRLVYDTTYNHKKFRSSTFRNQQTLSMWDTGGYMKCPKKYVEDYFARDGICFCFWNAPKSKTIIFDSFSESDGKMGHFKIFEHKKAGLCEKKSTWSISKRKKNRKWVCSILGHFKNKCICHHVKNTSSTYFLGHFK